MYLHGDQLKKTQSALQVLETPRMLMKAVRQSDLVLLDQAIFSDSQLMKSVYPRDHALKRHDYYVKQWEEYGFGFYTLFDREDNQVVGRAGLFAGNKPYEIEIGYSIARKYWRKGFATEACHALFEKVKPIIGCTEIQATIMHNNIISKKFAEKLGFVYEQEITYLGVSEELYVWKKKG